MISKRGFWLRFLGFSILALALLAVEGIVFFQKFGELTAFVDAYLVQNDAVPVIQSSTAGEKAAMNLRGVSRSKLLQSKTEKRAARRMKAAEGR